MWGTETGGERYKDPTGALLGYVRHTASTLNLLDKHIKTECNKTKARETKKLILYKSWQNFFGLFLIWYSEDFITLNLK